MPENTEYEDEDENYEDLFGWENKAFGGDGIDDANLHTIGQCSPAVFKTVERKPCAETRPLEIDVDDPDGALPSIGCSSSGFPSKMKNVPESDLALPTRENSDPYELTPKEKKDLESVKKALKKMGFKV